MRKKGILVTIGIIISLGIYVIAGLLYFYPTVLSEKIEQLTGEKLVAPTQAVVEPEMVKEEPRVVPPPKEEPKVVVEEPKVVVEEPKVVEPPKVVVEEPKVVAPPKVVVEEPKVVEPPKVVVEEPKVVAPPRVVAEEPKVVVEAPKVVAPPKVVVEAPPKIVVEEPPKVVVEEPKVAPPVKEEVKVAEREVRIIDRTPVVVDIEKRVLHKIPVYEEKDLSTTLALPYFRVSKPPLRRVQPVVDFSPIEVPKAPVLYKAEVIEVPHFKAPEPVETFWESPKIAEDKKYLSVPAFLAEANKARQEAVDKIFEKLIWP
ncbi:MAG: hypothetical protein WC224_02610 [Sphaerochaetaceae bacterium]